MTTTGLEIQPTRRDGDAVVWMTGATIVTLAVLALFFGLSGASFILLCLYSLPVAWGANLLMRNDSSPWLPRVIYYGWLAKIIGAAVREWVAVEVYLNKADAVVYYNRALLHVYEWRQFVQPTITRRGSGTNFVESLTALLYVPYIPDLLGGFFMFAMFAFLGQMLYYAAFRQMTPEVAHKRYALAIFFLPTMVYWPSSVGKDALIALSLGLATWGATSMFVGRWGAGAFSLLVGLGFTGAIRPHIAALFFGGVLIALVAGKAPSIRGGRFVRFVMVVVLIGGLSVAVVQLSSFHGLEISADSFGGFADEVQRRTSQGGSQVSGNPVTSPADIPEAALRVLYRPLLHEARNIQTLLSAIEGTFLLGLTILAFPRILVNMWDHRRHQYVVLSLSYTFGFIVVFSTIFNLGIMARQRSQLLPMMLVWLALLTVPREDLVNEPDPVPIVVARREPV